jgi:hypothetical protein
MDMSKQEFEMVVAELQGDGYEEAAPPGADVDREIVEAAHCPDCGGPLRFRPFKMPGLAGLNGSYRAFAVCVNGCGAYEF